MSTDSGETSRGEGVEAEPGIGDELRQALRPGAGARALARIPSHRSDEHLNDGPDRVLVRGRLYREQPRPSLRHQFRVDGQQSRGVALDDGRHHPSSITEVIPHRRGGGLAGLDPDLTQRHVVEPASPEEVFDDINEVLSGAIATGRHSRMRRPWLTADFQRRSSPPEPDGSGQLRKAGCEPRFGISQGRRSKAPRFRAVGLRTPRDPKLAGRCRVVAHSGFRPQEAPSVERPRCAGMGAHAPGSCPSSSRHPLCHLPVVPCTRRPR